MPKRSVAQPAGIGRDARPPRILGSEPSVVSWVAGGSRWTAGCAVAGRWSAERGLPGAGGTRSIVCVSAAVNVGWWVHLGDHVGGTRPRDAWLGVEDET